MMVSQTKICKHILSKYRKITMVTNLRRR